MARSKAAAQGNEAAAVGQAVGRHGDDDAGQDAEQAEPGPDGDQRERRLTARQGIHHTAEQHLLGQRDEADGDVGSDQPGHQATSPGASRDSVRR